MNNRKMKTLFKLRRKAFRNQSVVLRGISCDKRSDLTCDRLICV